MSPYCFTETLRSTELFADTSEEELRELSRPARLMMIAKGSPFYLSNEDRSAVYVLKSGRLKLSRLLHDGKEFILDLIEPGDMFGETSILDETPEETLGEALEDSTVCTFSSVNFERCLRTRPELALKMAKLMRARRKKTEDRLASLAFKKVPGRLAALLLRLSKDYGIPDARGTLLRIELSQREMGNLIGASREIVNLTLSDFRRQGLIAVDGRRLVICQEEHLERL